MRDTFRDRVLGALDKAAASMAQGVRDRGAGKVRQDHPAKVKMPNFMQTSGIMPPLGVQMQQPQSMTTAMPMAAGAGVPNMIVPGAPHGQGPKTAGWKFALELMAPAQPTTDDSRARQGMIAELDAVNFYQGMADKARDTGLARLLRDIADEEKVHVGEFSQALDQVDPGHAQGMAEGRREAAGVAKSAAFEVGQALARAVKQRQNTARSGQGDGLPPQPTPSQPGKTAMDKLARNLGLTNVPTTGGPDQMHHALSEFERLKILARPQDDQLKRRKLSRPGFEEALRKIVVQSQNKPKFNLSDAAPVPRNRALGYGLGGAATGGTAGYLAGGGKGALLGAALGSLASVPGYFGAAQERGDVLNTAKLLRDSGVLTPEVARRSYPLLHTQPKFAAAPVKTTGSKGPTDAHQPMEASQPVNKKITIQKHASQAAIFGASLAKRAQAPAAQAPAAQAPAAQAPAAQAPAAQAPAAQAPAATPRQAIMQARNAAIYGHPQGHRGAHLQANLNRAATAMPQAPTRGPLAAKPQPAAPARPQPSPNQTRYNRQTRQMVPAARMPQPPAVPGVPQPRVGGQQQLVGGPSMGKGGSRGPGDMKEPDFDRQARVTMAIRQNSRRRKAQAEAMPKAASFGAAMANVKL